MASTIHEEWLKRNQWVYDRFHGDPKLALPYNQLPKNEQDKDKAQIMPAANTVKDYLRGLIDIEELCKQYNIPTNDKTKVKKM